jgi:hypothetical protein
MHVLGALEGAKEGSRHTPVNGNLHAGQLDGVERILHSLIEGNVPRDDRNRFDPHIRVAQCHDQGHRIVGAGVGIDQKAAHTFSPPNSTRLM